MKTILNRMEDAIQQTYESIAYDIGKHTLDVAVECTLDANRMNMYSHDAEIVSEFNKLGWKEKNKIAKKALSNYFNY